jgi:hypothetical protein
MSVVLIDTLTPENLPGLMDGKNEIKKDSHLGCLSSY